MAVQRLAVVFHQFGGIFQLPQHHDGAFHHLFDLLQVGIHLLGHRALLLGGGGDLAVHVGHSLHPLHYGVELGTSLGHLLHPLVRLLHALGHQADGLAGVALKLLDHLLDLDGGRLGTVREFAHLGGDHGKTATRLTGAGGLDGGVQGQQVGLLGDAADGVHHGADAIDPVLHFVDHGGGALDVAGESVDGVDGSRHAAAALLGQLAGFGGGVGRLLRVVGHFSNGTYHLAHGAGKLLNLGELLVDGLVRLIHAESHLGGDLVELLAGGTLGPEHLLEVLLGVGHRLGDVAELVPGLEQHAVAEILVGETLQQPHQVVDLLDHEAGAGEQQHHEDDPHERRLHQPGPEQAIGDGVGHGGINALAEQGRFQVAGIEPEFGQQQQGAEHHEQHHLGHQSDVAHAPLQRVQLHNFSPFNVHYSFAVIAIGIIFLFINLHRA